MISIASFKVPITFFLSVEQQKVAQQALNVFYLGDAECNILNPETMEYEAKYPQKETPEFKEACHNIARTETACITVALDPSGRLRLVS